MSCTSFLVLCDTELRPRIVRRAEIFHTEKAPSIVFNWNSISVLVVGYQLITAGQNPSLLIMCLFSAGSFLSSDCPGSSFGFVRFCERLVICSVLPFGVSLLFEGKSFPYEQEGVCLFAGLHAEYCVPSSHTLHC